MQSQHRQFAVFLADRRRTAELTMAQLAERVGVSKSNVHYWEAGEALPNANVLDRLARALKVSYEDLLAAAGYRPPRGLPEPALYLRAKFKHVSEEAVAEAEQFFDEWTRRHRKRGRR